MKTHSVAKSVSSENITIPAAWRTKIDFDIYDQLFSTTTGLIAKNLAFTL